MEVNRRIMALAAALSVMTLVAGVHVASAQDQSAAAGIAVVDVQFLMENSAAANDVRVRIERVQAEYQQEAEANMQGITEPYERILVDRASLSDDAYQLRLLELRERAAARQSEALHARAGWMMRCATRCGGLRLRLGRSSTRSRGSRAWRWFCPDRRSSARPPSPTSPKRFWYASIGGSNPSRSICRNRRRPATREKV